MITAKEILVAYLKEHGFDGLCGDECGCGVDDIAPCYEYNMACIAAHSRVLGTDEYVGDACPGDTVYEAAPSPPPIGGFICRETGP